MICKNVLFSLLFCKPIITLIKKAFKLKDLRAYNPVLENFQRSIRVETAQEKSEVYCIEELHSIKEEVLSLRNEFSRFLQRANQQHIEGMLGEIKKNFMKPVVDYLSEDVSERNAQSDDKGLRYAWILLKGLSGYFAGDSRTCWQGQD